jgi:hypothetical protein
MLTFIKREKKRKAEKRKIRVLDRKIRRAEDRHERSRERHLKKERAAEEKELYPGGKSKDKTKRRTASPKPRTVAA